MLQDGDKVITRWRAEGTHKGSFRDVAATGRKVSFTCIAIDRVVRGQRVEGWAQLDNAGIMTQLRQNSP
jgi:predicted ester cyclase